MAGITQSQAQTQLDALVTAQAALIGGAQSYSIAGRAFTRVNLAELQKSIEYYQGLVSQLSRGGGPRVSRIIPI